MEKVPKPISTSACRDTPVTVGKLRNVRSGKQAMLTQRSSSWLKNKKKRRNEPTEITISDVYADGSITSDQTGWDFTVELGTTNIHERSAVYKVKTSSLTLEAIIVMDTLRWITPRCSSQTSDSVLSHSVKVQMEIAKYRVIMFDCNL